MLQKLKKKANSNNSMEKTASLAPLFNRLFNPPEISNPLALELRNHPLKISRRVEASVILYTRAPTSRKTNTQAAHIHIGTP